MIGNFIFGWILFFFLGISSIVLIEGNYDTKGTNRSIFIVLSCIIFFILGLFGNSITPDYPSYENAIKIVKSTQNPSIHLEPFWINFIKITGCNYFKYRLVLYLLIFLSFAIILFKLKNVNIVIFVSLYILILLISHIGLRATLFLMLFTLSLISLSQKRYILSIIILFISIPIHKVAYIAIPILICCIIPLKNNKIITLLGISILGIGVILHVLVFSNLSELIDYMWKNNISGSSYIGNEDSISDRGNIIWSIIYIVSITGVYFLKLLILFVLYKSRIHFNGVNSIMYKIVLWSTLFSFSILLIGLPDNTIAYRCSTIGDIPLCYLWSNFPKINISKYQKYKIYLLTTVIILFITQNIYIRGLMNRI